MREASTQSQVVLITGASSGIGASAARLFGAQGARVVLVARRRERLEQLADELGRVGTNATVLAADMTCPNEVEALVPRVVADLGRLDVLVNNAGYGTQCRFEDMVASDVARMFAVNVAAPMALARAAVPVMRAQGGGSILNVASVGGVVAHPLNVAYCASKHALVGFSKSLRLELKGTGVRVTAVCPGATKTEFFDVALRDIPFGSVVETYAVPADTVAHVLLKASRSNRAVVFTTWSAWFLYAADRWLPWASEAGNVRYRDQVLST